MVPNMRLISVAFTVSSIIGPLAAGLAMKTMGSDILMWQVAALGGALALYVLGIRTGQRQPLHSSSVS
jgi:hypothetical protein